MPDHNLNRLTGIIAEIVTTLGLDVGDCNLGPGPDICALGDEAVAALKARLGSTPSGRAEELIADLEAEIAKRDARIAELEAVTPCKCPGLYCVKANERDAEIRELAALKAQQPIGVVLPDTKHLKSAIDGLPDSYSKDDVIYGWQEALELVALLNPCRAQAVPYEFKEIGVIDESDDGVFVDLHDDQSFKLGQKVYAAAPSAQQKGSGDE